MNPVLKWKLIAGFLLVFIAGGVTGAFLSSALARKYLLGPHHHQIVAQRMRDRLERELELSPEQVKKISPIVERSAARLEGIRMATAEEVHQTFLKTHREIADNLSEKQRDRFEQMNRHRQHWMQAHGAMTPAPSLSAPPLTNLSGE